MAQEPDPIDAVVVALAGQRVEDADFAGARLHSPNFEGAKITDVCFDNANVSGSIEGLILNGVEVAPLVEAELDRRFPERIKIRAADPPGIAEGWAILEQIWEATVARAKALPEPLLYERVDGEWSFVETLRHLIFATDSWLFRMVRHLALPHHPFGMAGSWLTAPEALGLDLTASPALAEVLEVRRERMEQVKVTISELTADELQRVCTPPDTAGWPRTSYTVLVCLQIILNEEWLHSRYANRDLGLLEGRIR